MAPSRAKYRRLPDLYVDGKVLVLKDGTVMWLQVLNPFEADEARHDAQVARSRLVMALTRHGSDEMAFVETAYWQDGIEGARKRLVEAKASDRLLSSVESIDNDPDWTERLDIIRRSDGDRPYEEAEKELLAALQVEYIDEIQARSDTEEAFTNTQYATVGRDDLIEEYGKLYIERRGTELATAEYRVCEIWYGARACDGVLSDDGTTWTHAACESHRLQVFESKADVRNLAEDLGDVIGTAYDELAMAIRDAKDLARLASSSASSRQPSQPAASTPSTPTATPAAAPGTSAPPLRTLSRS